MSLRDTIEAWRVRRLAKRLPNIQPGDWMFDLGRPTPLACRIKQAYHLQQRELQQREVSDEDR